MEPSLLAFVAIALGLGALLGHAGQRFRRADDAVADAIDRVLPQTQCAQCGYPGCRPYAEAIAHGKADIDRCPPGGDAGVAALAALLGREAKPFDRSRGSEKAPQTVRIDEALCIGCLKCIEACPIDAIVGAPKRLHAVLEDECTGCELCLPPCPVDCIVVLPTTPARRREGLAIPLHVRATPRPIGPARVP